MAFIITKKSIFHERERLLYYLVANYRKDNKIKRKTLLKLGRCKTVPELFAFTEREAAALLAALSRDEKRLDDFLKTGKHPFTMISAYDTVNNITTKMNKIIERDKTCLLECQSRKEVIRRFL